MSVACNVVFAQADDLTDPNMHNQMTAKDEFRKFVQKSVAAIVKEFTPLNEGAVPRKPVAIPTDVSSITSLQRKKKVEEGASNPNNNSAVAL